MENRPVGCRKRFPAGAAQVPLVPGFGFPVLHDVPLRRGLPLSVVGAGLIGTKITYGAEFWHQRLLAVAVV